MTHMEKLEYIYSKTCFLYRQFMDLSNELAEIIKTCKGKPDEQVIKPETERQRELINDRIPAGTPDGEFELDIY